MPRALITGVTGQDGWYLSGLLLAQGYDVFGLVRAAARADLRAGVRPLVGDVRDGGAVLAALRAAAPDELYHLAAVSSVAQSWTDPVLVADVNGLGVLRILDAARTLRDQDGLTCRIVHASSREIFGDAPAPQSEETPIAPTTPYGAAKAFAQHVVSVYRASGLPVSSAILYNHESPRRPAHFVTRKITSAAVRIAAGSGETLALGDLAVRRDWGHAQDHMRAMILIARHPEPADFVIATGVSHTVADFVAAAFADVGIEDWRSHVRVDPAFERPSDASEQRGDARRAQVELGWRPEISFAQLVAEMVAAEGR